MPLLRGPYNARPPAGAAPHSGGRRRKRAGLELLLRNPLFFLIFAVRVSQKFCRATLSSSEVTDLCDRIAVEILKVINFYQFTYRSSSLEGIFLVGGGAALPCLRKAIEETVGLPLLSPERLLPGGGQRIETGVFAAGAAMGGK